MQRKLVKQGAATLMVSLPAKWCKANELGKGSVIDIVDEGADLRLSRNALSNSTETTINLTGLAESATRTAIVNAYRTGYARITIRWKAAEQSAIVERVLAEYLLGFDIASRNATECVLESITEPSGEQFESIVRKILYSVKLLLDETITRIERGTPFPYAETSLKIHRYDNFCRRVLSKQGTLQARENFIWSFLALIVHGQRELYHLNKALDGKSAKAGKNPLTASITEMVALLERAYGSKDLALLEQLHALEKVATYDIGYKALKSKTADSIVTHHLLAALRQFYLAASPLTGIILSGERKSKRA